jgi:hypothetical protein
MGTQRRSPGSVFLESAAGDGWVDPPLAGCWVLVGADLRVIQKDAQRIVTHELRAKQDMLLTWSRWVSIRQQDKQTKYHGHVWCLFVDRTHQDRPQPAGESHARAEWDGCSREQEAPSRGAARVRREAKVEGWNTATREQSTPGEAPRLLQQPRSRTNQPYNAKRGNEQAIPGPATQESTTG